MSSVGDKIRMDLLLDALKGKDVSNCTIIFGTCKDCKHNRNGICPRYRHFVDDNFYCADFERRGNENGI